MPTVNIYSKGNNKIQDILPDLKKYLAEKLTCGDMKLVPEEVSIRFINIDGGEMIANIEVEINAHAFTERVKNQDKICVDVMNFLKEKVPTLGEVRVWLQLSELGHSW